MGRGQGGEGARARQAFLSSERPSSSKVLRIACTTGPAASENSRISCRQICSRSSALRVLGASLE